MPSSHLIFEKLNIYFILTKQKNASLLVCYSELRQFYLSAMPNLGSFQIKFVFIYWVFFMQLLTAACGLCSSFLALEAGQIFAVWYG